MNALIGQLRFLAASPKRTLVSLSGPPGCGKSTIAEIIVKELGTETCCVVPMDGYHLGNKQLLRLGLREVKGRHDTFDSRGFKELIQRLKHDDTVAVYYPIFHRDVEESIAQEGVVESHIRLVIVEGLYLLQEEFGRSFFDLTVYLNLDGNVRRERLVLRRLQLGFDRQEAELWARGPDESNSVNVSKLSHLADVQLDAP